MRICEGLGGLDAAVRLRVEGGRAEAVDAEVTHPVYDLLRQGLGLDGVAVARLRGAASAAGGRYGGRIKSRGGGRTRGVGDRPPSYGRRIVARGCAVAVVPRDIRVRRRPRCPSLECRSGGSSRLGKSGSVLERLPTASSKHSSSLVDTLEEKASAVGCDEDAPVGEGYGRLEGGSIETAREDG